MRIQWLRRARPDRNLEARYRARKNETYAALDALAAAEEPARAEVEELAAMFHKLAGTAGFFGDEALGEAARAAERTLLDTDDPAGFLAELRAELAEWQDA